MIFYFSATGNSHYAALYIAKKTGDACIDIAQALREEKTTYTLAPGETVGFVTPVYYSGVPVIWHAFLYALKFITDERHYAYLVLTCGGMTGAAGDMFAGIMRDNDYELSAYFSVITPGNNTVLYSAPSDEKIRSQLDSAGGELERICGDIELRMTGNCDRHRGVMPGLMTKLLYPGYKKGRKTQKFYTTEKCTACAACQDGCPCEIIKMENGRPRWTEDECVFCLRCLNRCPNGAIEYGKKTTGRRRYQNPLVK